MRFSQLLDPPDIPDQNYYDTVLAIARASDTPRWDAVWMADHFQFQHRGVVARGVRHARRVLSRVARTPLVPMLLHVERHLARAANRRRDHMTPVLECFTTLAAIAASTTHVRIGSFVAGAPYRNPALLAKLFTTLDLISHGRCIAGIGAAWHEEEFAAYGWRFPSIRRRMEVLEDTVQIIRALMSNDRGVSYSGHHHVISNALNFPPPIQRPHPPILIGGSGERRTLRLVAQYADYCNIFGDPATVAHKLAVLHKHCAAVRRAYETIVPTGFVGVLLADSAAELRAKRARYPVRLGYPIAGTPEQVIVALRAFADSGVQHLVVHLPDAHLLEPVSRFAEEIVPALA
jgi:alkanesulfonate monooxygenase SsuD/methylene tetrahydromethanopterin reductase-like flavin-dependent oxidoreductase (luciferase family)